MQASVLNEKGPLRRATDLRVGLFGIGLDSYWPQFPALKGRLEAYLTVVEND